MTDRLQKFWRLSDSCKESVLRENVSAQVARQRVTEILERLEGDLHLRFAPSREMERLLSRPRDGPCVLCGCSCNSHAEVVD